MYRAPSFASATAAEIAKIIQDFSFATLISVTTDGEISVSHIPILAHFENDELVRLEGHLAQKNQHVRDLKSQASATLIFHGPHTYISPKWYRSGRDVPTWNYVVVHVKGQIEFVDNYKDLVRIISRTSQKYEGPKGWKFELPADLLDEASLSSAIIGFKMNIESVEAKFKLSQNRPLEDRQGVSEGLATRTDEMSAWVKALIDATF